MDDLNWCHLICPVETPLENLRNKNRKRICSQTVPLMIHRRSGIRLLNYRQIIQKSNFQDSTLQLPSTLHNRSTLDIKSNDIAFYKTGVHAERSRIVCSISSLRPKTKPEVKNRQVVHNIIGESAIQNNICQNYACPNDIQKQCPDVIKQQDSATSTRQQHQRINSSIGSLLMIRADSEDNDMRLRSILQSTKQRTSLQSNLKRISELPESVQEIQKAIQEIKQLWEEKKTLIEQQNRIQQRIRQIDNMMDKWQVQLIDQTVETTESRAMKDVNISEQSFQ